MDSNAKECFEAINHLANLYIRASFMYELLRNKSLNLDFANKEEVTRNIAQRLLDYMFQNQIMFVLEVGSELNSNLSRFQSLEIEINDAFNHLNRVAELCQNQDLLNILASIRLEDNNLDPPTVPEHQPSVAQKISSDSVPKSQELPPNVPSIPTDSGHETPEILSTSGEGQNASPNFSQKTSEMLPNQSGVRKKGSKVPSFQSDSGQEALNPPFSDPSLKTNEIPEESIDSEVHHENPKTSPTGSSLNSSMSVGTQRAAEEPEPQDVTNSESNLTQGNPEQTVSSQASGMSSMTLQESNSSVSVEHAGSERPEEPLVDRSNSGPKEVTHSESNLTHQSYGQGYPEQTFSSDHKQQEKTKSKSYIPSNHSMASTPSRPESKIQLSKSDAQITPRSELKATPEPAKLPFKSVLLIFEPYSMVLVEDTATWIAQNYPGTKMYLTRKSALAMQTKNTRLLSMVKVFHNSKRQKICLCIIIGGKSTILKAGSFFPGIAPIMLGMKQNGLARNFTPILQDAFSGQLDTLEQMRLICHLELIVGPTNDKVALNEICLSRGDNPKAISFEITVDMRRSLDMTGDGIIISTPFGSTAYTHSAGGAVVDQSVACLQLVPISPVDANTTTLILGTSLTVSLLLKVGSATISNDGKKGIKMKPGDRATITISRNPIKWLVAKD